MKTCKFNDFNDRWTRIWSAHMIHLIRFICYGANYWFLQSLTQLFSNSSGLRLLMDSGIFLYSILIFYLTDRLISRWYRPSFLHLNEALRQNILTLDSASGQYHFTEQSLESKNLIILPEEQYNYRINGEKIILTALIYAIFNGLLGILGSALTRPQTIGLIFSGGVGMFLAVIFTFAGTIAMVAVQPADSSPPTLYGPRLMGLFLFIPPWGFLLLTIYRVYSGFE